MLTLTISELYKKFYSLVELYPELQKGRQPEYSYDSGRPYLTDKEERFSKIYKAYEAYRQFIAWHHLDKPCWDQLIKLKNILSYFPDLNHPEVMNWVADNYTFFEEEVFSLYNELDWIDFKEDYFYIPVTEEYPEKKEFRNLICFHEVMWILFFGEYYLPESERSEPDDPNDYYYVPPDPEAPSELEEVLSLLSKVVLMDK